MANEIFISYRRADAGWAGRIYDRLEKEFESEGVFIDVKGIQAGHDFDSTIRSQAEGSRVMLAVIGGNWVSDDGIRRLESPDDFVRRELEIGLQKRQRTIPILIEETPFMIAHKLPDTLRGLGTMQVLRVTHQSFNSDVEKLIETIKLRLEEMSAAVRQPWDRTRFLATAREARGAPLEKRLQEILDWAKARQYLLRWGNGAKYGTAQISPDGSAPTMLSIDTTGLLYLYMNNLQQRGAFGPTNDREAFVDRLNDIQGVAIKQERVTQAFVSFQLRNVDQSDIPALLGTLERVIARRS